MTGLSCGRWADGLQETDRGTAPRGILANYFEDSFSSCKAIWASMYWRSNWLMRVW